MINNTDEMVTILVRTYNRAHLFKRLFDSIDAQIYRNFKVLIVDDMSPDNTKDVVAELKKTKPYEIEYYCVPSKRYIMGITNELFERCDTRFAVLIDSDDELTPTTISGLMAYMLKLDKNVYRSVVGRSIDSRTGRMLGEPFPEGINDLSWKKSLRCAQRYPGDKMALLNMPLVKQFHYLESEGITYIGESQLWDQINSRYREFYVNDLARVFHIGEGLSISTQPKNHQYMINKVFECSYRLNNRNMYSMFSNRNLYFRCMLAGCYFFLSKSERKKFGHLNSRWERFLLYLLFPLMLFGRVYIAFHYNKKWRLC